MSSISKNSFPFFGIGAEKAATSWIFTCLYEHPQVCIPVKEFNFFTRTNLYQRGMDWFFEFYAHRCGEEKVFGEFSTSYLYDQNAAEKIHAIFPQCKLIVSLRNPIERAYSNFLNDIIAGNISKSLTFEEGLKFTDDYLSKGKYQKYLDNFYRFFKMEQVHIILYDDIQSNPSEVISGLYRFLEVDSSFVPPSVEKKYNVSRVPKNPILDKISNKVAAFLQYFKWTNKIWWTIKKSGVPAKVRRVNAVDTHLGIAPGTYNDLISYFQDDINYVSTLTARKLDWVDER